MVMCTITFLLHFYVNSLVHNTLFVYLRDLPFFLFQQEFRTVCLRRQSNILMLGLVTHLFVAVPRP